MDVGAISSGLESLTLPLPTVRSGRPALGAINTRRVDLYLDQADRPGSGGGFALQVAGVSAAAARGEVAALEANETVSANRDAAASAEDLLARLPDDVRAEVGRYLNGEVDADYYSPERTADRISSFVIDGFARFEGGGAAQENSAEARQRFVDFITPAIDKGFKQALDILEPLHDGVKERVQETRELIGTRMAAFVKEDHVDTVA